MEIIRKINIKIGLLSIEGEKISNEILIINDNSSKEPVINCKNLKTIKRSNFIFEKNLGSQKAIAIGLDYLKKDKKDFLLL